MFSKQPSFPNKTTVLHFQDHQRDKSSLTTLNNITGQMEKQITPTHPLVSSPNPLFSLMATTSKPFQHPSNPSTSSPNLSFLHYLFHPSTQVSLQFIKTHLSLQPLNQQCLEHFIKTCPTCQQTNPGTNLLHPKFPTYQLWGPPLPWTGR